jgi:hypothetical protein
MGVGGYNLCLIITSMDSLTIHATSTRSILYFSTAFKPTLIGKIIFLYNVQLTVTSHHLCIIPLPLVKHGDKL